MELFEWMDVWMARISIQTESLFESSKKELKLEKHFVKSEEKDAL